MAVSLANVRKSKIATDFAKSQPRSYFSGLVNFLIQI